MSRRLLFIAAAGFFLRCAHVEPPPGGPVDTVKPFVVSVYPAPGARNVPLDAELSLQFSEWLEPAAEKGKALLSPPVPGMRTDVDGVRMRFRPGGLQANTAYRLLVPGALKDLHGNPMGKTFSLAFTTGGDFDSGASAGRILTADPRGMILAALYHLGENGKPPESWNRPAFLVPADSAGGFSFDSVSQGVYAMIAFSDGNGNFVPDPGLEAIGIGPANLQLAPRAVPQTLRLAPMDTAHLRFGVVSATVDTADGSGTGSGWLRLKFSRPPLPLAATEITRYGLKSKKEGAPVAVKSAGRDPATGEWILETGALQAGMQYVLEAKNLTDLSGTGFDSGAAQSEFTLAPSRTADTALWQLSFLHPPDMSGKDTVRSSDDLPTGDEFRLRSNKLLTSARITALEKQAEVRFDTLSALAVEWRKLGPQTLLLKIKQGALLPAQNMRIRLKPSAPDTVTRLLAAGKAPDSTRLGGFRFKRPDAYKDWTLVLQGGWLPRETVLKAPEAGDTVRVHTVVGPQRLYAFLDRDKDGIWHPGSLRPYFPQEPIVRLLDSLVVPAGGFEDVSGSLPR